MTATIGTDQATVLLIDDEEHILRALKRHLEDEGYAVHTARSGQQGLTALEEAGPDLVLLDLRMPDVDGLDVLRQIRTQKPDVPVIVVSGKGMMQDVIEAVRLGARDYVTKSVHELSVLDRAISRSLAEARTLRENRRRRRALEDQIQRRTAELRKAGAALERKNIALREVLDTLDERQKEVSRRLITNVEQAVMPLLAALRTGLSARQEKLLDQIEAALSELTAPFAEELRTTFSDLTATELRICTHLRRGLTTKEIAQVEGVSSGTIHRHRESIRRKLGLTNTKTNLTAFLRKYAGGDEPPDPARE